MPRHTQPREVALAKGSHHKHPERYRGEVPKNSHALGEAPDYLSEAELKVWFELEEFVLPGVMTGAERVIFETLCRLVAEYRDMGREFPVTKITQLIQCLARLGMTPADRQKLVSKPAPKNDDDFTAF